MEGFYKEVSSPILTNVTFDYLDSNIVQDSLTDTAFHTFYQGGEMVIAGMLDAEASVMPVFEYEITAHHTGGEFRLTTDLTQYFLLNLYSQGTRGLGDDHRDCGHLHRLGAELQHVGLQLHGAAVGLPQRADAAGQGGEGRAVQLPAGRETGKIPGVSLVTCT